MRAHGVRKNNQLLQDDQTLVSGVDPRPLSWPKFFVTRMLTRDQFAVANLLVYNNFTSCAQISVKFGT